MKIEPDAWDEWQAHPLTEALMKVCRGEVARAREAWATASFDAGKCDPLMLAEVRARAAAFKELSELSRETMQEALP